MRQLQENLFYKEKSFFYLWKNASKRQRILADSLGFAEGSFPFTYLGVPIFKGCPRRQHLQVLADKARDRLAG